MDTMWSSSILLLVCATIVSAKGTGRWQWMSDAGGRGVYLVDLQHPVVQSDQSTIEDNTVIYLYRKENKDNPLSIACDSVTNFDAKLPTIVLAHGWMSNSADLDHIKNAYLTAGDYNVISVDWSATAASILYNIVMKDLVIVGQFVAKLLDCMVEAHGLDLSNVHLAGHSLGAHVVGVIGGSVTQKKVAMITGMDPAGPGYDGQYNVTEEEMLDRGDAQFVQIIHTNTEVLGFESPMGHIDFYPNGGEVQPGCGTDFGGGCSHGRSTEYFAESITSTSGFVGYMCDNWETYASCYGQPWTIMGANADTSASEGIYYMNTASASPFAKGVLG